MFDKSAHKVGVSKKLKWREILIGKLLNLNYDDGGNFDGS